MNALKEMLGESGGISTTRVLTFFVVVDIMVVWTIMCVQAGKFVDFPAELIGLIGTFLTAKVFQKFGEKNGKNGSSPIVFRSDAVPLSDTAQKPY